MDFFSRIDFLFKHIKQDKFNLDFLKLLIKLEKTEEAGKFLHKVYGKNKSNIINATKQLKKIKYKNGFHITEPLNEEIINKVLKSKNSYLYSSKNKQIGMLFCLFFAIIFGILTFEYDNSLVIKVICSLSLLGTAAIFAIEKLQDNFLFSFKLFKMMNLIDQNTESTSVKEDFIHNNWLNLLKESEHPASKELLMFENESLNQEKSASTNIVQKIIELTEKINELNAKIEENISIKTNNEIKKITLLSHQYLQELIKTNDNDIIKYSNESFGCPNSIYQTNLLMKEIYRRKEVRDIIKKYDNSLISQLYKQLTLKIIDLILLKIKNNESGYEYKILFNLALQGYISKDLNVVSWTDESLKQKNLEINKIIELSHEDNKNKHINQLPTIWINLRELSEKNKNFISVYKKVEDIISTIQTKTPFEVYEQLI